MFQKKFMLIYQIFSGIERKHIVQLFYEKDFNKKSIPTKDKSIYINEELLTNCKKKKKNYYKKD